MRFGYVTLTKGKPFESGVGQLTRKVSLCGWGVIWSFVIWYKLTSEYIALKLIGKFILTLFNTPFVDSNDPRNTEIYHRELFLVKNKSSRW